jgi:hypothetical protein
MTLLVYFKKWIITLVFEKNAKIFGRKLEKIAENCNHITSTPECISTYLSRDFFLHKNDTREKKANRVTG